jgi:hypothetical protein
MDVVFSNNKGMVLDAPASNLNAPKSKIALPGEQQTRRPNVGFNGVLDVFSCQIVPAEMASTMPERYRHAGYCASKGLGKRVVGRGWWDEGDGRI